LAKPINYCTTFLRRGMVFLLKLLLIVIERLWQLPSHGLTTLIEGRVPRARTPRLWLTHRYSYRVRDGYVEILGGFRLRIIGWDMRYDALSKAEMQYCYLRMASSF
jgi:hypothetical protein